MFGEDRFVTYKRVNRPPVGAAGREEVWGWRDGEESEAFRRLVS